MPAARPDPGPVIRDARPEDLPAILAIHNDAILNSLAIWQERPVDLANRRAWFDERRAHGFPVLALDCDGAFAGYASFGPFRIGSGYDATVENSVYLAPERRGRGLGRALMAALIARARAQGRHVMVAGIGLPNDPSVALHRTLGFTEAGTLREIGRKAGHWLDLMLMQKTL
ncbi:MAG TPA: GNAT family N-acetyltransferase [Microvirga sp.]|jgi:phosphinothricin acetyltransferase|nr:GNAT family N-acetyltransferase [Microvirga sp.]